jgi:PAS domain S-box-containing protein
LFIGVTFLGAAVFDGFQILGLLRADHSAQAAATAQWGWIASRTYLAVFLTRLSLAPRGRARADLEVDEAAVYGISMVLVAAGLSILSFAPLPPLSADADLIGQGIPALLFFVALLANLRRERWQRNTFEHWLIVALVLGLGAQILAMVEPAQPAAAVFLAARVAKLLSYTAVFTGLLASVYFTYAALEESRRELAHTNRALQREITDRQATERELQIRTAFLEHLFESTPEAVVVLDREDRVQRINAEFTRLFGFSAEEAMGRPIGALIVPTDRAGEADNFSDDVARGRTVSAETVRRRKDGSVVDVSIMGTPVLVADGQIGVYGIYRDITDRKRAEQAMRRSAERLAAIIEAAPLAILTLDGDGVVRTWNPAAERFSGRPASEVLGRPLARFPLGNDEASEPLRRALAGETVSRAEALWTRRDGSQIHVNIATAPLEGHDASRGILVVAADVTERKEAEEAILRAKAAAEESNRSKSEFLASMSHELRTPLNSVIGFTRVLLRNKAGNLGGNDITYLERIGANGEHLLGLINSILDLSKIEAGMLHLELADTDLCHLVRETLAQLEGRVAGGPLTLRAELPDHACRIVTDAHRLRQVMINLIGNALKFTEGGEIVVSVDVDVQSGVPGRIRVSDTGIGIAPDRLDVIFDAFEQADRSTSRRYGGTGLGLSISRGICGQLGYDLTVASELGRGSTFAIHLAPVAARAAAAEEATHA